MKQYLSKLPPEALYGITGALIYVMATGLLYLFGIHIFFNPLFRIVLYLFILSIPIMAVLRKRERQKGRITYMEASSTIFITFLIIEVIWTLFYFALFNYIDPTISEQAKQAQIEYLEERATEKRSLELEEQMENISADHFRFTYEVAIESLLSYSIIGLILALVGGVFVRREEQSGLGPLT